MDKIKPEDIDGAAWAGHVFKDVPEEIDLTHKTVLNCEFINCTVRLDSNEGYINNCQFTRCNFIGDGWWCDVGLYDDDDG